MTDLERLKQWMEEKDFDYRAIASATGDTNSTVNMIVNGKRDINGAFKWRFAEAFGLDEAMRVFIDKPVVEQPQNA